MRKLIFVLLLLFAGQASAACTWSWDCSRGPMQCRQVPYCDSRYDIVPPRPPEVAPIAPPSIQPIPQPMVAPPGMSQCLPKYICDTFGACSWQTICR